MLVFCIKQLLSLKRAILGRREPHQLAWGMALGVWLGVVPYGNLVALVILLFILSLRVNHGMVAVTALATSVIAALFDAQTHGVGKYILTHPHFVPQLSAAWQWPLVPWTDLNNTVVMGGLLLGLTAVVPTYLLSYPLFRYLAPPAPDVESEKAAPPIEPCEAAGAGQDDPAAEPVPAALPPIEASACSAETVGSLVLPPLGEAVPSAIDAALGAVAGMDDAGVDEQAVELVDTRIEVVRLVEVAPASEPACCKPAIPPAAPPLPQPATEESLRQEVAAQETSPEAPQADPPVSEALNYLLRQLRDSHQRRAA